MTPAPPTEELVPQWEHALWARVYGKILLCFFFAREFWGAVFLPAGSTPQWEGGEASATYVLQARVLFTCIFFWGHSGIFFTNVCTCAHLRMCLLHCIHASSFALTR